MFVASLSGLPDAFAPFRPAPDFADRRFWEGLPDEVRQALVAAAEVAQATPFPQLTASAYMAYCRTGNRVDFETLYFQRRTLINDLALGECVEGRGRFIDALTDGLWLLAEETGWQLPAHNAYQRGGPRLPLPDPSRPVIDLFAAETAANLAMVLHLLGAPIAAAAPGLPERLALEIEGRILSPYGTEHFWWMGRGDERMNNWTAWITQNVLLVAFTLPSAAHRRRDVVVRAAASFDAFLKDYADDGGCEEGVLYYRHAALCLAGGLQILSTVAPACFGPLWQAPKLKAMAEYSVNLHVHGDVYLNFADSSAVLDPGGVREYLFGRAVGSRTLADFAARDWQAGGNRLLAQEWNLWYRLQALSHYRDLLQHCPAPLTTSDAFYRGIGLFVARDDRYTLAVKAGHNGESHNHNDVGSVILYDRAQPVLIDVGVETYRAQTFSPQRYDIWTMQSAFHNLPSFAGVMQRDGASFAARDVATETSPQRARISLDLAGAYPPEAGLVSYRREVTLVRGVGVVIEDRHDGAVPATLSLMLRDEPRLSPGTIDLPGGVSLRVEGAASMTVETIAITDPRLRKAWPARLFRVLVPLLDSSLRIAIGHAPGAPSELMLHGADHRVS